MERLFFGPCRTDSFQNPGTSTQTSVGLAAGKALLAHDKLMTKLSPVPLAVTFIILERSPAQSSEGVADLTSGMIGDVNLFVSPDPDSEAEERDGSRSQESAVSGKPTARMLGELEIMIAEADGRRKGYASQALELMIRYALHQKMIASPGDFVVRIGMDNQSSITMFEKLGFTLVKEVSVFREIEMRITTGEHLSAWAERTAKPITMLHC